MNVKQEHRQGFTLIELLVVIAIIGLLASVVMVNLNSARQKARDSKRKMDLSTLQTAVETYADRYGNYPSTFAPGATAVWQSSLPNTGTCQAPAPFRCSGADWIPSPTGQALVPDFVSVLPFDPRNNALHFYAYASDGNDYKMMAWTVESKEGASWAVNDGGAVVPGSLNRNVEAVCGKEVNNDPYQRCNLEIFSSGAKNW